jgi:hypothetical protein
MAKDKTSMPAVVRRMFGKRPIIGGEDAATYDQLLRQIIAEHSPQSLHQWLLIKDIADAAWELLRLSRMKAGAVNAAMPRVLRTLRADGVMMKDATVALMKQHLWDAVDGGVQAQARLNKLLREQDLSLDELAAAAFERTIGSQAQIDRMTTSTANRRDAAYAELARLRSSSLRKEPADDHGGDGLSSDPQSAARASNGAGRSADSGRADR